MTDIFPGIPEPSEDDARAALCELLENERLVGIKRPIPPGVPLNMGEMPAPLTPPDFNHPNQRRSP